MHHLLFLLFTALLLTSTAQAQTHRWHDLTPDSLKGATFPSVAVGYDGDQRVIYTSYVKQHGFDPSTGGLLKSTDSGRSWQHFPFYAEYLVTPPEHAHLVYAIRFDSLYKSIDGGQTWANLTPALLQASGFVFVRSLTRVEISPHDTARVVVARSSTSGGLFFSDDGGATFRYVDVGGGSDGTNVNVVASPNVEGRVYVPVFRNGAVVSEDFYVLGNWGRVVEATYHHPQVEVFDEPSGLKIDVNEVLYSRNWISRDEGKSWTRGTYYVTATAPTASVIYGGASVSYEVSYNSGQTWQILEGETPGSSENEVIDSRDSTLFAAMHRSGIFAYARRNGGHIGGASDCTSGSHSTRLSKPVS